MKNVKHKKYKNTGLIYEMLIRKITSEVVSGGDVQSLNIIKEHFSDGKEIQKELSIYRALYKQKFENRNDAKDLVESLREAYNKLDIDKLQSEKYTLVKSIKESVGFDKLFCIEIPDYKVHASIYNLLEYKDELDPVYMTRCKSSLLEHITNTSSDDTESNIYKGDPNLLTATYKIFVNKFNEKYSDLSKPQKSLLREYVKTPDNSVDFKEYFVNECSYVESKIKKFISYNPDKSLNVKLENIITWLDDSKSLNFLKEDHISTLMKYQDLLNELNIKDERFA